MKSRDSMSSWIGIIVVGPEAGAGALSINIKQPKLFS
jgi:RNA polymerase subunit RPABC4/transcription elongation factor Spt4